MKKNEMIDALSKKTNLNKKQSGEFFANVIEMIMGEILKQKEGEYLRIAGFGTFGVRKRAARMGLNPQTRQPIKIEAKRALVFRPGKHIKEALNNVKKK